MKFTYTVQYLDSKKTVKTWVLWDGRFDCTLSFFLAHCTALVLFEVE